MDRATAERVLELLTEAGQRVNQAIGLAFESGDADSASRFRRVGGRVMGEIHLELVLPIFDRFPDLVPDHLRSSFERD
jgi:hypothetical protein